MKEFFDLSHDFDENTYHPIGYAHFQNIQTYPSHGCRYAIVTLSLHFGTHIDAPWHMLERGKRLDEINIAELIGDALIVDVSDKHGPGKKGAGEIPLEDIQLSISRQRHELHKGDALLIHTGWSSLYRSDPSRYYGSYCTISRTACEWAIKTGIRLFGIDAPDVDPPESYQARPFKKTNHRLLLESDVYIIENVGGEVAKLAQERVLLIPAPLKIGGQYASGAPIRLLAVRQTWKRRFLSN